MSYIPTLAAAEWDALKQPENARPYPWRELVPKKHIQCRFYDIDSLTPPQDEDERRARGPLDAAKFHPTQKNVVIAASMICQILRQLRREGNPPLEFALVGGTAIDIWGAEGRNRTEVAVIIRDRHDLVMAALLQDDRFILPDVRSTRAKSMPTVFMQINAKTTSNAADHQNLVRIQLNFSGYTDIDFAHGTARLEKTMHGYKGLFRCLNIVLLFRSEIRRCVGNSGGTAVEAWNNAANLLKTHQDEIQKHKGRFDYWHVKAFLSRSPEGKGVSPELAKSLLN
ncbi:MAG: hypothetical protein M1828_006310 [Chrysothrix sp. TS-e1954]|nr:MAG: hypothetical protein M1828_006310 [Chrysothrix sp. TS-e1954]